MKKEEKMIAFIIVSLLILSISYILIKIYPSKSDDSVTIAMGTTFTQSITNINDDGLFTKYKASDIIGENIQIVNNLENVISWRNEDSMLYILNHTYETNIPYKLDDQLYSVLNTTFDLAKDSNGALEPTIRPLANVWKIEDGAIKPPSKEDIDKSLEYVDYKDVELKDGYITLKNEGMILDLGAVGKGIGCDYIYDNVKDKGVCGVFALGGSIVTVGDKKDNEPWVVGITHPRDKDMGVIGTLNITGHSFISTSGDYEKYFIYEDKRYNHILNSETGNPCDSGLISVTIVCDSGLISDGLSTAVMIKGKELGSKLMKDYNATGIFISEDKKVYVSQELVNQFTLKDTDYEVVLMD